MLPNIFLLVSSSENYYLAKLDDTLPRLSISISDRHLNARRKSKCKDAITATLLMTPEIGWEELAWCSASEFLIWVSFFLAGTSYCCSSSESMMPSLCLAFSQHRSSLSLASLFLSFWSVFILYWGLIMSDQPQKEMIY